MSVPFETQDPQHQPDWRYRTFHTCDGCGGGMLLPSVWADCACGARTCCSGNLTLFRKPMHRGHETVIEFKTGRCCGRAMVVPDE